MTTRDLIKLARAGGWEVSRTRGDHLRLVHEDASMPVFAASTPSDHRAIRNALPTMRRAMPQDHPKPPRVVIVEERRLPKRRPKPKPKRTEVDQAIDLYRPPDHRDHANRYPVRRG